MFMAVQKLSGSRVAFQIFNYTLLISFTLLCLYPFWYMLIYTVSTPAIADITPPILLPKGFTLFNYFEIFKVKGFFNSLLVSVLRTVVGAGISVFSCALMGYLFSKQEMPARSFLYRMLIITMYISGGLIPTFLLIKSYGLLNNFWVFILPSIVSAYNVVLIKTFVEQLPPALEESARIDGAGYFTIFCRIIFPLSIPIVATVAIFSSVGHWNSWFDNHIYASSNKSIETLQYLLYKYLNEAQRLADQIKNASSQAQIGEMVNTISTKGIRMTITVLASLPIFIVYPFMQRFFVKGIMLGAVKG